VLTLEQVAEQFYAGSLDPADLIATDEITMKLYLMVKYVQDCCRNSAEGPGEPWTFNAMRERIWRSGIYFHATIFGGNHRIVSDPEILVRIAQLPRAEQQNLLNLLFARLRSNERYAMNGMSASGPDTITSGIWFLRKAGRYNYPNVQEKALLLLKTEQGSKEAGVNLDV